MKCLCAISPMTVRKVPRESTRTVSCSIGCDGDNCIRSMQRSCQNNSAPIKMSMSEDTWNCGSANLMLRRNSKFFRLKENAGSRSITCSVTIQFIVAQKELVRDCRRTGATRDALVVMLPIPEIEMFDADASTPKASKNFLEIKFACDLLSSNTQHCLREPPLPPVVICIDDCCREHDALVILWIQTMCE